MGHATLMKRKTEKRKAGASHFAWFPLTLTLLFLGLVWIPPIRTNPHLILTILGVGGGLLLWQFWLALRINRDGRRLETAFVPVKAHYVQASVQFCVYAYWGWYWPKVYAEAPLILSQILFLYAFTALLAWSRGRTWQLGFGVLPIIFSTNLFMWFSDDGFIFQYLMVATGALGKEFIQWEREGRRVHIFNPSAFGLALFSLALILTGTSQHTWGWEIATTLGRPPYIYVEIFLLGLVVQSLFGVTLMTFSAAATLCAVNLIYTWSTGVYFFVDINIPIAVFLGLHLLMTDPATTPRTNIGKFTFGSLYGLGVCVCYVILRQFNQPEYYDKLLVVPFLNLGVQLIDRLMSWNFLGAFSRWEMAFGLRKLNAIHMACWAVFFAVMLGSSFIEAPHPGASIAFWGKAAQEGRPYAIDNLITKLTLLSYSGNAAACAELTKIYQEGKLVPRDPAASAKFLAQARELALPPNGLWNPGLMARMETILTRQGKDWDVPPDISTRLGLTEGNQAWASRQIAGLLKTQSAELHSFSVSRDELQPDLLLGLRTPTQFYLFRSRRDGTLIEGHALVIDEATGQGISLADEQAQPILNQEFLFWAKLSDQLLPMIPPERAQ
jgi:hypothetical protein